MIHGRVSILLPFVTMASLIAALGTVEHSLELLYVPSRAFFSSYRKNDASLCRSRSVSDTTGTCTPSSSSAVAKRSSRDRVQGFSYNCTNVYPHVEEMEEMAIDDDLVQMSLDGAGWSDSDESFDDADLDYGLVSFVDQMSDELLIEFGRKPRVFDDAPNMTFYISPLSISQLATGLWTRSRPACVIINTSIPRGFCFDDMDWSDDSLRMLNTPNAGGSSLLSEVLSCEMLNRCLGATLAKTEMEIKYLFAYQPITDYTVCLPSLSPRMHVGVSVTRAFAFKGAYRRSDCRKLLYKKLRGILASTKNVIDERFFKQILHVWVPNGKVARTVQATYKTLPIEVTRNTVVIISVVNAPWVFSNRR
ncbi:hypothetical protein BGZ92_010551 [Podila epicladia]|nr:hypothetical protein BGZ92_010551 [Podila epicladia]